MMMPFVLTDDHCSSTKNPVLISNNAGDLLSQTSIKVEKIASISEKEWTDPLLLVKENENCIKEESEAENMVKEEFDDNGKLCDVSETKQMLPLKLQPSVSETSSVVQLKQV